MGNSSSSTIEPIDYGAYIGYTQGGGPGQLPTLYFENGRLTQEHRHPENVGWHPLRNPNQHVRLNVTLLENDLEIEIISGHISGAGARQVVITYLQGRNINRGTTFLFEFDFDGQTAHRRHRSRGELLFDGRYDEAYAIEQIDSADLAENAR